MSKWIVGNWKMNGSLEMLEEFIPALAAGLPEGLEAADVRVAICPPLPYLAAAREKMKGTPLLLGAQNVHPKPAGAFTGEVAAVMLAEMGTALCIVGHSERRQLFGEDDAFIAEKPAALLAEGIIPVYCVGETLEEREGGNHETVVERQLRAVLDEVSAEQAKEIMVAYEPVWAIGTGRTATPQQANSMHEFIRGIVASGMGESEAGNLPILYGGSVNAENAGELLSQPEINGALVGGASMKASAFLTIINNALN